MENDILYLIGADRRGTIYAIYDFCESIGVSPWYFFADVPIREKESFFLEEFIAPFITQSFLLVIVQFL